MALRLEGLRKTWSGFELRKTNLAVEKGEYFIILGPTGAGKTLLLETIMGFYKPDEGKIILNGQDITALPPERRRIGYVSQNCVLFPHMNVRQNIEFGLRMLGSDRNEREKTVDETLHTFGLKPLEFTSPLVLSGGEKRKVSLARVLAAKYSILLLDEPLSGIDASTAAELRGHLKHLQKEGKTIIHVTHDQVEAFSLGNRIAIMRYGEIVQVGKAKEVFAKPASEFVAKFLGYENVFKALMVEDGEDGSIIDINGTKLKTSRINSLECVVALRPEDIQVQTKQSVNKDLNTLSGTVLEFADYGPYVTLTIDTGLIFRVVLTKTTFVEWGIQIGQEVWISFKKEAIKTID